MRDYIKAVRAKSAHPLGRNKSSASLIGFDKRERSAELSTSLVHSTFATPQENKYEKSQKWKEKKEIMRSFTDKRLDRRQRARNREQIDRIKNELEAFKQDPDRVARKEHSDLIREQRFRKIDKELAKEKEDVMVRLKATKEHNKKAYLEKFPPISKEVKELREKEYKEEYLNKEPLHLRWVKQYEEQEERKLKEVKDQLHQLKVQPIDFVVSHH